MDRILARLERRFGKYAIAHLSWLIVGGMAAVFVLGAAHENFINLLTLDLSAVARGQVWRLFTYLFIPTTSSPLWFLISLYWVWMVGTHLENQWGPLKFNVYYLLGMLGTTAAAAIAGISAGNTWLNLSLLLAFATVFPNYEIFLFFVLRIKMKWLGIVAAAFQLYEFATSTWPVRAAILAASLNYFLFFTGHLVRLAKDRRVMARQSARLAELREPYRESIPNEAEAVSRSFAPMGGRTCAMCGAREEDGADIRVCTCAKCGSPRTLCLPHARSH